MIRIFNDKESLNLGAAEEFVQCAKQAMQQAGRFSVALSGGQTPRRIFELLARLPFRERVDWDRTHVFWGDERCVPQGDSRSNAGMAFETLLNHVPVPREQIHPISCDNSAARGAMAYEALLKIHFRNGPVRFDLILLGLGENGHTASLFPETPVLKAGKNLVSGVRVADENFDRVTLTAQTINNSVSVVFLVSGLSKASVLRSILQGPQDPYRLPAQLISPVKGELLWLVDRDAASQLEDSDRLSLVSS